MRRTGPPLISPHCVGEEPGTQSSPSHIRSVRPSPPPPLPSPSWWLPAASSGRPFSRPDQAPPSSPALKPRHHLVCSAPTGPPTQIKRRLRVVGRGKRQGKGGLRGPKRERGGGAGEGQMGSPVGAAAAVRQCVRHGGGTSTAAARLSAQLYPAVHTPKVPQSDYPSPVSLLQCGLLNPCAPPPHVLIWTRALLLLLRTLGAQTPRISVPRVTGRDPPPHLPPRPLPERVRLAPVAQRNPQGCSRDGAVREAAHGAREAAYFRHGAQAGARRPCDPPLVGGPAW